MPRYGEAAQKSVERAMSSLEEQQTQYAIKDLVETGGALNLNQIDTWRPGTHAVAMRTTDEARRSDA